MSAILVIEDSPEDQAAVARILAQHQLTFCETLESGLTSLRANKPDAIVLDLNLPDSEGIETAEAVSDVIHQLGYTLPVVVNSGTIEAEWRQRLHVYGWRYVVRKSSFDGLGEEVEFALAQTQLLLGRKPHGQ